MKKNKSTQCFFKHLICSKILFLCVLSFLVCGFLSCGTKSFKTERLAIYSSNLQATESKTVITVELAQTFEERQQGFMNRDQVLPGHGMLFVFPSTQYLSFWMKNTSVPLSIAYVSETGIIQEIYDMEPFSEQSISSVLPALYALEVPQGWFEIQGIKVGSRVGVSELSFSL